MATLDTPLQNLIGGKTVELLVKAFDWPERAKVSDLLFHFPTRHVKRGEYSPIAELQDGDEVTIVASVKEVRQRFKAGRNWLEVVVGDGTAELTLTFFGQFWLTRLMTPGRTGLFAGKIKILNSRKWLAQPEYQLIAEGDESDEALEKFSGAYIPIYRATKKMPSFKIAKAVSIVLEQLDEFEDFMPEFIRTECNYPSMREAIIEMHQMSDESKYALAKERLKFDEAFMLQIFLVSRKNNYRKQKITPRLINTQGIVKEFESRLPFKYTKGQLDVNNEIENDLRSEIPMRRLLQGEVGSGKTVIALRAMLSVIESGGQAALLAPTEVLAQQHEISIRKLLGDLSEAGTLTSNPVGTNLVCLTGSVLGMPRKEILNQIKSGSAGIVIGTHALLSESVEFSDLALVVVDEQHRFGVEQRDSLRFKASTPPHLLVMTATPIPRTVAITAFGDLDISTLRELPSGRKKIETYYVNVNKNPNFLDRTWQRIREEVLKGHQAYVVCPRIGDQNEEFLDVSDKDKELAKELGLISLDEDVDKNSTLNSVIEMTTKLQHELLPELKVKALTGRMTSSDKERIMREFASKEIDVLVSTTVIEVGVDVANASMMVIMDADRFGISQLHQLRGRVGRGVAQGLCLLISKADENSLASERLQAVAKTLDGFELALIDLEQRREGDILGQAQSGYKSNLKLLVVFRDGAIIESALKYASHLIENDDTLSEFNLLSQKLKELEIDQLNEYLEKN